MTHLRDSPEHSVYPVHWQSRGKAKNFHAQGTMTFLQFAAQFVPADLYNYVHLTHDPREENSEGRRYPADHTPYIEGGTPTPTLGSRSRT